MPAELLDGGLQLLPRREDGLARGGVAVFAVALAEPVQVARQAQDFDLDIVESEILRLPRDLRWLRQGYGKYSDTTAREAVFASWEQLKAAIEEFGRHADADLAVHLRDELWEVVGLYQEAKKRAGQLDF